MEKCWQAGKLNGSSMAPISDCYGNSVAVLDQVIATEVETRLVLEMPIWSGLPGSVVV